MQSSIILLLAKEEIKNAVLEVQGKYNLRPCVIEDVLSSVLLSYTKKAQEEVAKDIKEIIEQKNEELEKAKAAAKKVLSSTDEKI